MAITIQDVQDLIQLLRERPEWRAEMERALLGEEFHSLPAVVRELAEAQKRTEARVGELAEAQKRTEARMDQLAARMDQLAARMDELAARMDELARRLEALTGVVEKMRGDIGDIRGELLEIKYAERVTAYVSDFLRRSRVIPRQEFLAPLEEAEEQGTISGQERKDAALIDMVVRGQLLPDRVQAHAVFEISATIYPDDVERADRRAKIFSHVYPMVIPVVGGYGITAEARKRAEELGVRMTLDGVTIAIKSEA